jgi:hypothetical protein
MALKVACTLSYFAWIQGRVKWAYCDDLTSTSYDEVTLSKIESLSSLTSLSESLRLVTSMGLTQYLVALPLRYAQPTVAVHWVVGSICLRQGQ